jgi:hypothetical protein
LKGDQFIVKHDGLLPLEIGQTSFRAVLEEWNTRGMKQQTLVEVKVKKNTCFKTNESSTCVE